MARAAGGWHGRGARWSGLVVVVLVAAALVGSAYAEKPPSNPDNTGNSGQSSGSGQSGSGGGGANNGSDKGSSGSSNAGGQSKPAGAGGSGAQHTALPGPGATLSSKAKAYGHYCQNQSKLHVAGRPGTPFGQCVTAMAKLATHRSSDPWSACSALSRTRSPGTTRSPFSRCVLAGTRLLNDLRKP